MEKYLSLESVSFLRRPSISRYLIYALYSCSALAYDKDKGARGERPLPTPLLFNDLRLFYYRAKIPAKVISVRTSKNRLPTKDGGLRTKERARENGGL